jgi:hypothetical protein
LHFSFDEYEIGQWAQDGILQQTKIVVMTNQTQENEKGLKGHKVFILITSKERALLI